MISNGAKTAFDIWYEWDKHIYENSEIFTKILEFVKSLNTQNSSVFN